MEKDYIKSDMWGTCIWGIDDTGRLFIGDGIATTAENSNAPWEIYKNEITEVNTFGTVCVPDGASMEGLFRNCKKLEKANLKDFKTTGVRCMARMFENCEALTEVNLESFNTEEVRDFNHMFSGCRSLANLDLTSFDTRNAVEMTGMFSKCRALHALVLGENFSTVGEGAANCGNLSIRDTGKYRIAKVVNAGSSIVSYIQNGGDEARDERKTVNGMDYVIENLMFAAPSNDYVFVGWNTEADGSGTMYEEGHMIPAMGEDMELYATWIGLPKVGHIQPLKEIEYGSPLPFELTKIISENDGSILGHLEISPNGDEGTWQTIERDAILPASYNGYLVRLCVRNKVGKAYSNAVRIRIKKAGIDISKVRWTESESMTYDGSLKSVWLEGMPEGVNVVYSGNEAVDVGEYNASVSLEYDTLNYDIPLRIRNHAWSINKAKHDMSAVRWDYEDSFEYDGKIKEIRLSGLPDTVQVTYSGNKAIDAGVMTAVATLTYDTHNYEKPSEIIPRVWEIRKAPIDTSKLSWTNYSDFVFDGTAKKVSLSNLPEDAQVEYSGEEEILAGKYLARANVYGNYYSTAPIEYEWEIRKADYDMSYVGWEYSKAFEYNKETQMVRLHDVPEDLNVRYYNNVAMKAGDYEARASFTCIDTHNYNTPDDMTLLWSIRKSVIDMSDVRWNYSAPFVYSGEAKSVELTGIPDGVYAIYENNTAANAGVYNARAILKYDEANYEVEQPADCQWQINKAKFDFSDVYWDYSAPFTYDGREKSIELVNLPDGLNVEYKDNAKIDSGKYVATAKLTPSDFNNFEAPEINGCTWSIGKYKLTRGEIKWSEYDSFVYDGKEKSVKIVSDLDDQIKVEYSNNVQVNAGTYTARATFFPVDTQNYEAPVDATYEWSIKKSDFDMKEVVWDYTSALTYSGKKKSVKLLNVPEGLIVHYENETQTDAGDYVAIARFEAMNSENYNDVPEMTLNWKIQKSCYDFEKTEWQEQRSFSYTGEPLSVELVGLPDGVTPIYENNEAVDAAEYTASVSFEYDETNYDKPVFDSCRWKIVKADCKAGSARWDYQEPFIYDGGEKGISVIDIPEGVIVETNNTKATDAGTYMATAELIAEDKNNYNSIALEGITWKILKGEYDMSYAYWDYEKPFTYDGTEKKIVMKGLPEGVFPIYTGNTGIDSGEYTAVVTFNVADINNYNIPESRTITWKINKADYDMSVTQWTYSGEFTYNGRMKEIQLRGLPDGVRAVYKGNCATNVGSYVASAQLIPYDEDNYNIPTVQDCNWGIVKADYDMSAVRWDYSFAKVYNEREQYVELENLPNGIIASYSGNTAIDVGRYTARAKLSVSDAANYNVPAVGNCDWEVVCADIDMNNITWTYDPAQFVYDGTAKTVTLENIPKGVSVTYHGNTATDAGTYIATADFSVENKNYRAPASINYEWEIRKAICDISCARWNYGDEFTYNGKKQGIELADVPAVLKVAYTNNKATDAGEYVAQASFKPATDNYEAPDDMFCRWVINKANIDISKIRWDYDNSFLYDGKDRTIELAGVPNLLNVKYSGNIAYKVGKYIAHADLYPIDDRNYNAPSVNDCSWEIIKITFDMSNAKWVNNGPFTYDGNVKGVHLEGLPAGVTPVYTDNKGIDVGQYTARAVFEFDEENYNTPYISECKWSINKSTYDMSAVEWNNNREIVYDGSVKTVALTNLPAGVTPVYSGNRETESGIHEASVVFKYDDVNYENPTFESCKWEIEKAEIKVDKSLLRWNYEGSFVYDGSAKSVSLFEESEEIGFIGKIRGRKATTELVGVPEGVEAFYEDNVQTDVGVYYARAILRNTINSNYKDLVLTPCKWEITKASVDMSKVRWNYSAPYKYDGEEKSVRLVGVPKEVLVSYEDNAAINAGSYEAQAKLELKDPHNYAAPMPVKGCWWQIERAKYDMSNAVWTYDDNIVYNGKEKTVRVVGLPEGVKVEAYSGNKGIEAGAYTAEAIFKYKNKENYEEPEIPALRWKIHKKKIDISEMRWNYDDSTLFVYDGKVKEVKLVGVPKDVEVVYINNSKVNAGQYIARARLTYDTKNFEAEDVKDCRWSISKANFNTSKVHWNYDKPFKFDTSEKSISLMNVPSQIDVRYRDNKAFAVGTYTAKAYLTYDKDNFNPPEISTTIDWEIIRMDEDDE